MMNLQPYREEIFRRSAQRIKKRRQLRSRVLMLCIPLALVVAVALAIPKQNAKELAQDAPMEERDYATGSIACSYVKAELTASGKTVTVTDKLTVDKLYFMLTDADGADLECGAVEPETFKEQPIYSCDVAENKYTIRFSTAGGAARSYTLTQEQYEELLEVLK